MQEGEHAAQAGSKPQPPAIELSCPTGPEGTDQVADKSTAKAALYEALCSAVLAELQDREVAVATPLSVRMQIREHGISHLTAALAWQTQGQADWTLGPDLTLSAADRALSPKMMTRFARDLVTASALPR